MKVDHIRSYTEQPPKNEIEGSVEAAESSGYSLLTSSHIRLEDSEGEKYWSVMLYFEEGRTDAAE